jgi:nucleotide-binding universal stress UspA family protein
VSSPPLAVGQRIDGFELLEHRHRGGMASLWRVTRPDLELPAVMKVPAIHDDPTTIVGFEVEQMIMPLLSGPHVPRFIASGGFEAQPYIVMEYIEGATLRSRLDESPLPASEVAAIGAAIAEALDDLHHQHAIHLDVKPSNIMFRPDGHVVLIDYGLARHEKLPDLLAEEFRLPLGTSPYISPEQVLYVRDDPRSDLFALGATLYHLATGQRAFGTPTSIAGLRKRLYRAPVPPRVLNPDCPPWLQEIVLHCLEVDPEQRYGSAAQVAFDLTQPGTVALTSRADRTGGDPLAQQVRRWLRSVAATPVRRNVTQQLMRAPIVLVAVDLSQEWEALADALRATARRVLQIEPHARLACVSVLKTNRIALDAPTDEAGRNRHVQLLVQLQHWARPLALPPHRITYHVLEAPDPAAAIIDYARVNRVDHIVIGCRGLSGLRRYLGGVSTRVVVEAPCSVTVVKVAREEALGAAVSA